MTPTSGTQSLPSHSRPRVNRLPQTVGTDSTAMNPPRPPRATNARACLQCQKRKTKCIQDARSAACTYCVRARKECVFEEAPSRTPLTRKNLDALERRCAHLENLVRSLAQGIDVEAELEKVGEGRDVSRAGNEAGDTADEEYEWHESPEATGAKPPHVADSEGMASMAVETSGYLGTTSSHPYPYPYPMNPQLTALQAVARPPTSCSHYPPCSPSSKRLPPPRGPGPAQTGRSSRRPTTSHSTRR